jgi:FAD:protein FMN transferase
VTGPHIFSAMGCRVVVAGASRAQTRAVERLFAEREARFSRFLPDSELARVNASAGRPVLVSAPFAEAVAAALDLAAETGGLCDPTVGAAIGAAGYDRDFAQGLDRPEPSAGPQPGTWRWVRLDGRLLHVPRETRLDLNGVVKAMAVDDAAALLDAGWVSAGGDLACRGPVDVGLPDGGAIRLAAGGIATSGSARRRWTRAGVPQHHLIDPRTGAPARSDWEQVTVAGASCLAADAAARAAFLRSATGPPWLDGRGMPGRFVTHGGSVVENATWAAAATARPEPACM